MFKRRHDNNKRNFNCSIWLKLLTFVTVGLVIFQVWFSNRLAMQGTEIGKIDDDIEQLSFENSQLQEKIASTSSLLTIKNKAFEMGFSKPINPLYLTSDLPIALDLNY